MQFDLRYIHPVCCSCQMCGLGIVQGMYIKGFVKCVMSQKFLQIRSGDFVRPDVCGDY